MIIRLELGTYAEIRRHPRRFFSAPGHEETSLQNGAGEVFEVRDTYVLVDKVGVAGEIAAEEYEETGRDSSG